MKKVLLLGGSHFQVPSIVTAKRLGYYTITCDYLPSNPGHKYADEYYNVSTTDREGVLELAKKLRIDGIVCYASDPAAPTAAYVAEQMGLPTSPYRSVEILANKDLFRAFLAENNFNVPKAKGYAYEERDKMLAEIHMFHFPVMLKPVDSSGSKGVRKIERVEELPAAVEDAMRYSRAKRFIIEEWVEKNGYQIGGDGFSVNGELRFRCFANQHFDSNGINPYVPVADSYPYNMPEQVHNRLHNEIQRVLSLLHMGTQAYNFELRIDMQRRIYLMEIGPRNGGNFIPQVTKYATGVDMVEYTVKAAMGEDCSDLHMVKPQGFWANYMLHSSKAGILREVQIAEDVKKRNLMECKMICRLGEYVEAFTGAGRTLGILILKFDSRDEMLEKMDHMERWVQVITE